jgi:hypothetical protein
VGGAVGGGGGSGRDTSYREMPREKMSALGILPSIFSTSGAMYLWRVSVVVVSWFEEVSTRERKKEKERERKNYVSAKKEKRRKNRAADEAAVVA